MLLRSEDYLVVEEVMTLQFAGHPEQLSAPVEGAEEEEELLVKERVDVEGDGVEGGGGAVAAGQSSRSDSWGSPNSVAGVGRTSPGQHLGPGHRMADHHVCEGLLDVGQPGQLVTLLAPVEKVLGQLRLARTRSQFY